MSQQNTNIPIEQQSDSKETFVDCCEECGNTKDKLIYMQPYGYVTYCSSRCFRETL